MLFYLKIKHSSGLLNTIISIRCLIRIRIQIEIHKKSYFIVTAKDKDKHSFIYKFIDDYMYIARL